MALLQGTPEVVNETLGSSNVGNGAWNVIVKQTFIEVVIPACCKAMRRTRSEPVISRFEKTEMPWKSSSQDKLQDVSDASTNDGEDSDANFGGSTEEDPVTRYGSWSSESECDKDAPAHPEWSHQYPWHWVTMGYDFDQVGMSFDGAGFFPMPWMDPSMLVMDCSGVDTTDAESEEWRTTVMIRNMPNNYTRDMLLELVDEMGFAGTYDFVYLPIDFATQAGLGYAFVNFSSVDNARICFNELEGFSNWKVPSEKVCTVTWSSPTQGFEAHIDRYRNSPVMHPSIADDWKPVLFLQGMRVPFPPPTKPLKTPKIRQHSSSKSTCA